MLQKEGAIQWRGVFFGIQFPVLLKCSLHAVKRVEIMVKNRVGIYIVGTASIFLCVMLSRIKMCSNLVSFKVFRSVKLSKGWK